MVRVRFQDLEKFLLDLFLSSNLEVPSSHGRRPYPAHRITAAHGGLGEGPEAHGSLASSMGNS